MFLSPTPSPLRPLPSLPPTNVPIDRLQFTVERSSPPPFLSPAAVIDSCHARLPPSRRLRRFCVRDVGQQHHDEAREIREQKAKAAGCSWTENGRKRERATYTINLSAQFRLLRTIGEEGPVSMEDQTVCGDHSIVQIWDWNPSRGLEVSQSIVPPMQQYISLTLLTHRQQRQCRTRKAYLSAFLICNRL